VQKNVVGESITAITKRLRKKKRLYPVPLDPFASKGVRKRELFFSRSLTGCSAAGKKLPGAGSTASGPFRFHGVTTAPSGRRLFLGAKFS
jgi:hypothetical protein